MMQAARHEMDTLQKEAQQSQSIASQARGALAQMQVSQVGRSIWKAWCWHLVAAISCQPLASAQGFLVANAMPVLCCCMQLRQLGNGCCLGKEALPHPQERGEGPAMAFRKFIAVVSCS